MSTAEDQVKVAQITHGSQRLIGVMTAVQCIFVFAIEPPKIPAGAQPFLPFGPDTWPHWPLTSVAIVATAIGLPASFAVPRLLTAAGRRRIVADNSSSPASPGDSAEFMATDEGMLAGLYFVQLILGAAINEGIALLGRIAYMTEGLPPAHALEILLILGLAARFPTLGRVRSWIESQQVLLLEDRQSEF